MRRSKQINYSYLVLAVLAFLFVISSYWVKFSRSFASIEPSIFYVALDGNDTNDGSLLHPWATIRHAADVLEAGETVYIRAGKYSIAQQIRANHSGTANNWITYAAYPGEHVVIDADAIEIAPPIGQPPFPQDQGAFQLENVSYVRVSNLEVMNSHNSGFTVRNSHHIELLNNKTENTLSPGIGVWQSHYQKVMGNTIINANAPEMLPVGFPKFEEMPHEAISLEGVQHFEVAYNLVQDSQKEGIDVKGASKHGTVHHNYIHHIDRQGLYVDSWHGVLEDIEVSHNVVHDCKGAGFVISVEGGSSAENVRVHHNLLYDNWGTGVLFGRWGTDGLRRNIKIYHNTVHHNGYGQPNPGENFYWITGGLYLFSDNIQDVEVRDNIFSKNSGFQIGYSDRYLNTISDIDQVFQQKNIKITHSLIFGPNSSTQPIYAGWAPDNYANIYGTNGTAPVGGDPKFVAPEIANFYLQLGSPAIGAASTSSITHSSESAIGAFPLGSIEETLWWKNSFPPQISSGS